MNYLLVVLTHGADGHEHVDRALASLTGHVTPLPAAAFAHADQANETRVVDALARHLSTYALAVEAPLRAAGFCKATATAWKVAAASGLEYVLYLEHDFIFTRDVDLHGVAVVLDANPQLAQMALMRNAVNEQEKAAGGLFGSRPGQWTLRETDGIEWLEEREFFTTNPSLMRRDFMAQNPWPDDGEPYCEGRFGIGLRERGYSFGFLGRGEVWVEHVGTRSGFGY